MPTHEKSIKDVKHEQEFEFDPDTLEKIYKECSITSVPEDSLDLADFKMIKSNSTLSAPGKQPPEKKSFAWNLLNKITNGLNDSKTPRERSPELAISQDRNGSHSRSSIVDISIEADREWESEVFRPILHGVPAKALDNNIMKLIESGNYVPSKKRGLLWRKLVSNRGRINKRLFMLLLAQLDNASPSVRESIVKDMDRTYGEYKASPTYCDVKNESIKVLQLFDVTKEINQDPSP